MPPKFLIDSNIVINGVNNYPRDIFRGYWTLLEQLHDKGELLMCDVVRKEIEPRGDEASDWVRATFAASDDLLATDATIVHYRATIQWAFERKDPTFQQDAVKEFARGDNADAWLVAYAKEHQLTILTNETSAPRRTRSVKLPDAATAQGVVCRNALALLRDQGVSF